MNFTVYVLATPASEVTVIVSVCSPTSKSPSDMSFTSFFCSSTIVLLPLVILIFEVVPARVAEIFTFALSALAIGSATVWFSSVPLRTCVPPTESVNPLKVFAVSTSRGVTIKFA